MLMKLVTKLAASLAALGLSFNVLAAELNVYASMPEKYASQVLEQFTKETGIKVKSCMILLSFMYQMFRLIKSPFFLIDHG